MPGNNTSPVCSLKSLDLSNNRFGPTLTRDAPLFAAFSKQVEIRL